MGHRLPPHNQRRLDYEIKLRDPDLDWFTIADGLRSRGFTYPRIAQHFGETYGIHVGRATIRLWMLAEDARRERQSKAPGVVPEAIHPG